jgi:hypothetical protein
MTLFRRWQRDGHLAAGRGRAVARAHQRAAGRILTGMFTGVVVLATGVTDDAIAAWQMCLPM